MMNWKKCLNANRIKMFCLLQAFMVCAAFAQREIRFHDDMPVLVVDVGTATVISCISEQKALVGVAIAPGPISAQEGLHKSAALIPDAELSRSAGVLGKNTPAALRSGLVTGHACMIDGMIARIREEYRLPAATPVVITGGLAPLVTAECRQPMTYEKDLTLMGLYYIYTATAAAKAKR